MSQNSFKELIIPKTKNTTQLETQQRLGNNLDNISLTDLQSRNSPSLNINIYQNFNFSPLPKMGFGVVENSRCPSPEPRLYSPIFQHYSRQNTFQEQFNKQDHPRNLKEEYKQNFLLQNNNQNKFSIFKLNSKPVNEEPQPVEQNNTQFFNRNEQQETKEQIELNKEDHWQGFIELAVKVFSGDHLTENDMGIQQHELEAVNYILHRKFNKRMRQKDIESENDVRLVKLNQLLNSKTHKRPEECYKFIFTRTLKNLMKKFASKKMKKNDLNESFYRHYFQAQADKNQIPLEYYFYPLTKGKGKGKQSLNAEYFQRIFESKEFLEDFKHYMKNQLMEDYKQEIQKKMNSMAEKFEEWNIDKGNPLGKKENPEELMMQIKDYAIKNSRCKIAWCSKEIDEAIERVELLIENHASNQFQLIQWLFLRVLIYSSNFIIYTFKISDLNKSTTKDSKICLDFSSFFISKFIC